jgi:hypothetical protein
MPSFPTRDFTNQYISESYQNVLQKYQPTGSTYYLLDGRGEVVLSLPSASYGQGIVTTGQTVSQSISASYANVASSAATAIIADTASLAISAEFADTASLAVSATTAISASYAPGSPSTSASYAVTSSWANTASVAVSTVSASNAYTASFSLATPHLYVGMLSVPSFTSSSFSPSGSIVHVGTGSVCLCTNSDGTGILSVYALQSASFAMTASLYDAMYVLVTYNNGSPIYTFNTNKDSVDGIQTTQVFTVFNGVDGALSYTDWDSPAISLPNKQLLRTQALEEIKRETGLVLGQSSSMYVTITSGSVWKGIVRTSIPQFNSATGRMILFSHSASVFSGSIQSTYINTVYDDGTNLVPLSNNYYVVNWVYRSTENRNSAAIQLGTQYRVLADAVASQPPAVPGETGEVIFLVGRAIFQQGTSQSVQIDSAFNQTFSPAGITDHNNLNNIQGGSSGNYYHLTSAEYGNTASGSFLRQSGSVMVGMKQAIQIITASYTPNSFDYALLGSGSFIITLPSTTGLDGQIFNIKKIDNSGSLVISASGTDLIDGQSQQQITTQYASLTLHAYSGSWFIF